MKTHTILSILSLVIVAFLVGCGGSSSGDDSPANNDTQQVVSTTEMSTLTLIVGQGTEYSIDTTLPNGLTDSIVAQSSDTSVVSVLVEGSNLLLSANAQGSALITVTAESGRVITLPVEVTNESGTTNDSNIPQNVSASDGTYSDKIVITWDAVTNASGYIIFIDDNNGNDTWEVPTTNTYIDTNVNDKALYTYYVKATVNGSISDASTTDTGYVSGYSGPGTVDENDSDLSTTTGDGSKASPIVLVLNVEQESSIGSLSSDLWKKYYKFTTLGGGDYTYQVSNSNSADLDFVLYSNSDFTESISSSFENTSDVFLDLQANTTYYLEVNNYDLEDVTFNIQIISPATENNSGTDGATLSLVKNSITLDKGMSTVNIVNATTDGTTADTITATSSDVNVATVEVSDLTLLINSVNVGSATITVTSSSGKVITFSVTITAPATTITHNGVSYGEVVSPATGRVWLDRNLGAKEVCSSYDDVACRGDYYQWGRETDGHEKVDSVVSEWAYSFDTDINNAGSQFINANYDWTTYDLDGSLRSANWNKTDGSSICPVGFKVPSMLELDVEKADVNFLKLPAASTRKADGVDSYFLTYDNSRLWTSTSYAADGEYREGFTQYAYSFTTDYDGYMKPDTARLLGCQVRCIKSSTSD